MIAHAYPGSYSLLRHLSSLAGHWAGDVHNAEGTLVGREQLSCAWDTGCLTFRVTSCLVARSGRVLGTEQAQLTYDPRTDSITALFRQGGTGRTDLARAYANAQNELVLVSDGDMRLRRFSWPTANDPATPSRDTWHHYMEVATGDHLAPEWRAVLYRV